jgi:methionyl aminopeptidase
MEKGGAESSIACARCGKPASLQCPKCAQLKLPREGAAFCTQDCFKEAWSSHKSVHIKLDALTLQQTPEGWQYCLKKGRTRTSQLPRFDWTGPLRPYPISKMCVVPDKIEKPDWALDGTPKIEPDSDLQKRVEIKTPEQIERMRETCRIAREVLDAAARIIKPGITTDEIDRVVHEETVARGLVNLYLIVSSMLNETL